MNNTKRTSITLDEVGKVLELAKHGLRGTVISRALDRSDSSVYNILRAYGVAVKPAERTEAQFTKAFALALEITSVRPTQRAIQAETQPDAVVELVCKECGAGFDLTTQHIQWFEERGWSVPKRCSECRERRRGMHDGQGHPAITDPHLLEEIVEIRHRLNALENSRVS